MSPQVQYTLGVENNPNLTLFNKIDDMEETLSEIKDSLHPTLFLLHPQIISNKPLFDIILSGPDGMNYYRFQALKSSCWNANNTLEMIHKNLIVKNFVVDREKQSTGNEHQKVFSAIDLDSVVVKQSLGALLSFMQMNVFQLDNGKIIVSALKMIPMGQYMKIDTSSFNALQIFAEETHPNVLKGVGRSKVWKFIEPNILVLVYILVNEGGL